MTAAALRGLLRERQVLHAPGVTDAISATLVRDAGFEVAYLSGATTSAVALGLPDLGYLHAVDVVGLARTLMPALRGLPLVADADTGYGNALQARRTTELYAAAGIAALHIEDQSAPKRCGHMANKSVVPIAEAAGRIRAATEAGTGVVIIARTDVLSIDGLDAALERAAAFAQAGADLIFVEGATTAVELAAVAAATDGLGTVFNRSEAGGTSGDGMDDQQLADVGVRLVIHPVSAMLAAAEAMRAAYASIRQLGNAGVVNRMSWSDLTDLLGLPHLTALESRYS